MPKIARVLLLAAVAASPSLLLLGCPHPVPNPGQVVLSCTMDAVKDPKVLQAVMDALAAPDWRGKLASLIGVVPGVTGEVIACVLRSFLGQLGADPAKAQQYSRARTYLHEHGYEAP
jgi:hypothetical protein